MKVIGIGDNQGYSSAKYICEISLDELNKVFDFYYNGSKGYDRLKIGDEIDLKLGHNFYYEFKQLIESFEASHKKFNDTNKILYDFIQGAKMVNGE